MSQMDAIHTHTQSLPRSQKPSLSIDFVIDRSTLRNEKKLTFLSCDKPRKLYGVETSKGIGSGCITILSASIISCFPLKDALSFITQFISQNVSINPEIWYLPGCNQRRAACSAEAQASRFSDVYTFYLPLNALSFRAASLPRREEILLVSVAQGLQDEHGRK